MVYRALVGTAGRDAQARGLHLSGDLRIGSAMLYDFDAAAALRAVHKTQVLVSARKRDLLLAFDDAMAAGDWERAREIRRRLPEDHRVHPAFERAPATVVD